VNKEQVCSGRGGNPGTARVDAHASDHLQRVIETAKKVEEATEEIETWCVSAGRLKAGASG